MIQLLFGEKKNLKTINVHVEVSGMNQIAKFCVSLFYSACVAIATGLCLVNSLFTVSFGLSPEFWLELLTMNVTFKIEANFWLLEFLFVQNGQLYALGFMILTDESCSGCRLFFFPLSKTQLLQIYINPCLNQSCQNINYLFGEYLNK